MVTCSFARLAILIPVAGFVQGGAVPPVRSKGFIHLPAAGVRWKRTRWTKSATGKDYELLPTETFSIYLPWSGIYGQAVS